MVYLYQADLYVLTEGNQGHTSPAFEREELCGAGAYEPGTAGVEQGNLAENGGLPGTIWLPAPTYQCQATTPDPARYQTTHVINQW